MTIFFLLVYAAVNLACLALEWASAPNFRYSAVCLSELGSLFWISFSHDWKCSFHILSCLVFQFRPSFRCFTWHTCTLGIIGCLLMMFLINAIYAFASIAFMLLLVMLIHYLGPISNWGFISQALIFHQVHNEKEANVLTLSNNMMPVYITKYIIRSLFNLIFINLGAQIPVDVGCA